MARVSCALRHAGTAVDAVRAAEEQVELRGGAAVRGQRARGGDAHAAARPGADRPRVDEPNPAAPAQLTQGGRRRRAPQPASPGGERCGRRRDATDSATSRRPSSSTSPAPSTRHRSPSRSSPRRTGSAASKVGSHSTGRPPAASAAASATSRPADAGEVLGALARRVDVEHGGHVGPGQRGAEVAREPLRARVEVRLEDRDHPPRRQRAGGVDGGGHLGRVMGVVVDRRARRCSWSPRRLEAPPGAGEVGQRRGGRRGVGAGQRARPPARRRRCARCGRPGRPGARRARATRSVEPPPSSAGRGDVEGHVRRVAAQGEHVGAVPQDGLRRAGQQRAEDLAHLGQRAVGRVVVELDVRHHRDVDVQREHRAVRLVGLDHEPLARAPVGVEPGRRQRPADQVGGLEAAAQQHVRGHRRRRGLAVRAGDRDRALERAQLARAARRAGGRAARARARRRARGCRAGSRSSARPRRPRPPGTLRGVVADVDLDAERAPAPAGRASRRDRSPRPRRRAASRRARSRSSRPRRGRSGAAAARPGSLVRHRGER